MHKIEFSIVIPVKAINDYVRENVPHIINQKNPNWELIILPNEAEDNEWEIDSRIRVEPSGRVGPAEKRDLGVELSKGAVVVFLDDDSYPNEDLLNVLSEDFQDEAISAVGGPGITPRSDSTKQQVSGAVFLSRFTGGNPERYVPVGEPKFVDDWPSVNLAVRRSIFLSVGGFDSKFWPGEDTEFCLKLSRSNHKILYDPRAIVWHHRREGLRAHLNQVGNYGLHRGYFARHLPENSRKIKYFFPSLVSIFWASSIVAFNISNFLKLWLSGLGLYLIVLVIGFVETVRYSTTKVAILAIPYVLATHAWYGIRFLQGIFRTSQLVSKLR